MALEANLGKASVAIRATLDKLDGDLSDARGKVDNAVGRIAQGAGKRLQQIGTMALSGIGVATGAVAGLGAALGKITVDAAPVQGISDAFEGMAESAGYSQDEMLSALKRGSSGMVSQRDLMMSYNKAAQLVSTEFATQLPDAMQYLSKVSAATGQDVGFMLDSLVTGVGRLSPMILDNLGIQVSQAEAVERASEMYGVQASELDKAQTQAGMMNVVLEKLAANTESMPDVTESAAAKMAQFKATMQDTKDQIGVALLPVLATLMTTLGKLAESVLPPLTDFIEGTLAPALETVANIFGGFVERLEAGYDPLTALQATFLEFLPPDLAMKLIDITTGISDFLERVREVLDPIMEWISENVELKDVLIGLGVAILSVVIPALLPIIGTIAGIIAVFAAVTAIVALVRAAWENNFLGIRDIAENVWGFIKEFIPEAIEKVREIITNVVTKIQEFWAEHGDTIQAKAQEMWDAVVAIFEWFKGQYQRIFDAFRLAFEGDWRGFGEKLREVWDEAWRKIKEIGEKAWDAIKRFFKETDWGSVGKSILEGIAKGITAGLDIIKNAAKSAAKAALDAAKGFLGIKSPSEEAATQIGDPFGEGISKGLRRSLPDLERAAMQASARLMQATQRSLVSPQMIPVPAEASAAGGGLTIPIHIDHVSDDIDIEVMARRIARVIQRRA